MKKLVHKILSRSFPYSLASLIAIAATLFYYRISTWLIIGSHYPELKGFTLLQYLSISTMNDIFAGMLLLLILTIGTMLFPSKGKFISIVFIVPFTLFHVLGVHFFGAYETSFQRSYIGSEHFTGLQDMALSFAAEVTAGLVLSALILTTFSVVVILKSEKIFLSRRRNRIITAAAIPIMIIFLLFNSSDISEASTWFPSIDKKVITSLMGEFSLNPVAGLLKGRKKADETMGTDLLLDELPKRFSTQSIVDSHRMIQAIDSFKNDDKKNILIYLFESTHAKYLDIKVKGKSITPYFNKYRKKGIYFPRHYANYPLSANAFFSIMTSTYEMCSKKTVIETYPHIKRKTLSDILKERGYRTMLIHTGTLKYARQDRYLKDKKFDVILDISKLRKMRPYNKKVGWGLDERVMLKPIMSFIKKDRSKPWFIVIMPVNPHHPYVIPDDSFMVAGKAHKGFYLTPSIFKRFLKQNKNKPEDQKAKTIDFIPVNSPVLSTREVWIKYLNSLNYADYAMGYIIDNLEKNKFLDKSLVFLLADHGEAFYQHRRNYNHPFFVYEENVNVPMILYSPSYIKKGGVYSGISRHIDIMPTILDAAGYRLAADTEGISLISRHRLQYAFLHTSWREDILAIRDGQWKYIRRTRDNMEELYDLTKDPEEKKNLASLFPNITSAYRKETFRGHQYKLRYYKKLLKRGKRHD